MKRFIYFFILISLSQHLLAQNTEPTGTTPQTKKIDKQLNDIAEKSKTFVDPKYETLLLKLKSDSEKEGYDWGVLRSGNYLTSVYLGIGEDKKTIDLANDLKKIAKDKKDIYGHISSIYRRSALALGYLGLNDASFEDFQKAIAHAKTVENNDRRMQLLSFAYENINVYYENRGAERAANDSMFVNYKRSLAMAKMISNKDDVVHIDQKYDLIAYMNMRLGLFYLEHEAIKGYLESAEKYLLEAQKIYENKKYNIDPANKAQTLNELSRLYILKKDYQKAIESATRSLEFEKLHSYPLVRKKSYEFLLEAYLEIGDNEKSKFYRDKYTVLNDSLDYVKKQDANTTMKEMVSEVDNEHKQNSKKQWIITGILVLAAAIATIIIWRIRSKRQRKNYEQTLYNLKNMASISSLEPINIINEVGDEESDSIIDELKTSSIRTQISSETEIRLLKKLNAFEKSEKFLKKDITLSILSAQMNTNSKYLSEVIKNNKSLSFSNYINNLRIDYIVQKLYNDPKYREYKISYLAEESGYSSSQVFVVVFKKIYGMTPSYFIQSLKDDNI